MQIADANCPPKSLRLDPAWGVDKRQAHFHNIPVWNTTNAVPEFPFQRRMVQNNHDRSKQGTKGTEYTRIGPGKLSRLRIKSTPTNLDRPMETGKKLSAN